VGSPASTTSRTIAKRRRAEDRREGLTLLAGIVALMWIVEAINALDSYRLDTDGIYARNFDRIWGIFTAPFIHASFVPHLLDNTIPLVFMGVIIALRGAGRLALVTLIVIVLGGLGTWLVSPGGVSTIGASGVVFGYATYLFARGFFNRSPIELLTGLFVGVIWGGALISSLVPHTGVSWQGHVCGGVAGVVAAYLLRRDRPEIDPRPSGGLTARVGEGRPAALAK
jgi:membrane associated rhomboid family serine protease